MGTMVTEQETVINFSRDSNEATVYTSDSTVMTKLDKLADPENSNAPFWKVTKEHRVDGEIVAKSYVTNKRLISFRAGIKELSEDQKEAAANRMREWQKKRKQLINEGEK